MSRGKRRKPVKAKAKLQQQTTPPEPYGVRFVHLPTRTAGIRVTEENALTCGPVWACVRCISESLATLPLRVHRKLPEKRGTEIAEGNDTDWLLHVQANEETSAFIFREVMVAWALTWGNGYAEIERDRAGRVLWLWQLTPDRVHPDRTERGRLVYDVWNPSGPNTVLEAADVVHLKGLGFDGIMGYSVIAMMARAIALGMAADEFSATYFANDSTPGGILEHPMRLSKEAADNLKESWQMIHGGVRNRRRVAILEEGMKWHQTGLPPEDSQLLEARQWSITDIARWFRVPPHKIGDLSRSTFSNIESQEIEFVIDTLGPWAVRFEQELNIKLFGRVNRGMLICKHNFNGRLRGDTEARGTFYMQMVDRGIYDINEVREKEDLNPIGSDGEKRFVPLNMQLLENAGEQPLQPPVPPAPPATPGQPQDDPPAKDDSPPENDLRAALMPVLVEACGRVLRRESHDLAALAKPGKFAEHLAYAREAVTPGAVALTALLGLENGAAQQGVEGWTAAYAADLERRLSGSGMAPLADPVVYAARLVVKVEAEGKVRAAVPTGHPGGNGAVVK